jgi:hypothetical protein
MRSSKLQKYKHLTVYNDAITHFVNKVDPGSYTGYFVFGKRNIESKCLYFFETYTANIESVKTKILRISLLKIYFSNYIKKWLKNAYSPNGCMMKKISKRTLVGK